MSKETATAATAEAQVVREIMEQYADVELLTALAKDAEALLDMPQLVVTPVGKNVQSAERFIAPYRPHPLRREGTARVETLDALIAYVNRFAGKNTAIFASERASRFVAVIDHHEAGYDGKPNHGRHRAEYACPHSDEWERWTAADGKAFGQGEFAEFLEDRVLDVIEAPRGAEHKGYAELLGATPGSPSKLMEVARGLHINAKESVKQAANISTGEIEVQYEQSHTGKNGAPVKVPNLFYIAIPVYRSGALYTIPVRLRYRLRDGAITWFFKLVRPEKSQEHAFDEMLEKVRKETKAATFLGTPEGPAGD